jgi:2,4-dienoyl-CoA reductase-like NADH-dependent reductase (Old Yellow Enzyme family)
MSRAPSLVFGPGRIGPVELPNRIVRAGTSECMATPTGAITDDHLRLYSTLARNRVGLIFTGHMYCERRGQYERGQPAIDSDEAIGGLTRLASAVHDHGGKIFAQIAHAGSQSLIAGNRPLAPSPIANAMTGRDVREATVEEIEATLAAFGRAAGRAIEAGFDGVHVHGANGYLISEFSSPLTNRRRDAWGGDAEARDRFALEVVRRVRAAVPPTRGLSMKLGLVDAVEGGLGLEESVRRAGRLVAAGLDAVEVSSNVMRGYADSAMPYVAVDRRRALRDLLLHRALRGRPAAEAYFRPWARALRARVDTTIVLVGGLRRTETMEEILASGDADFLALARPLVREPDLVRQLAEGRRGRVDCTSCNLCLMHDGYHSLRCWRTPRRRLLHHALFRLLGGFRHGPGTQPATPDAGGRAASD